MSEGADVDRLKLLPCPFCGAAAKLKRQPRLAIPDMTYWVGCVTPNCPGDQVWEKIREEAAVEAWNSRQSPSQEAVRNEALEMAEKRVVEAAIDEIQGSCTITCHNLQNAVMTLLAVRGKS